MSLTSAELKLLQLIDLKQLAKTVSAPHYGKKEEIIQRILKTESGAGMLQNLLATKKKEGKEKVTKTIKKTPVNAAKVLRSPTKFSEKFINDYNLKQKGRTKDPLTGETTFLYEIQSGAKSEPIEIEDDDEDADAAEVPAEAAEEDEEDEDEEDEDEEDDVPFAGDFFLNKMKQMLGGDRAFVNKLMKKYGTRLSKAEIEKLTDEEAFKHCAKLMLPSPV